MSAGCGTAAGELGDEAGGVVAAGGLLVGGIGDGLHVVHGAAGHADRVDFGTSGL